MMSCLFSVFRHEYFISHRLRNLNLRLRSVNICMSLLLCTTNNISFDVLLEVAILETESLAFYPSNVEGLEIGMKCSIFYFCKIVLNFFSTPHLPSIEFILVMTDERYVWLNNKVSLELTELKLDAEIFQAVAVVSSFSFKIHPHD